MAPILLDVEGVLRVCGLRAVLVRTGTFRAERLADAAVRPGAVDDSVAGLRDWLEGCASAST